MSRQNRSHGVKLDGSPVCGTRVGAFTINCITPTCARCVAAYKRAIQKTRTKEAKP